MKSIVLENSGHVSLKEFPKLEGSDGDVLIKMKACGICRSDLENISGKSCKPTNKLGHEVSGQIIKVGKNVKDFAVGDRVFVHHHSSCNECHFCMHGNQTMCDKYVNSLQPCGMSEEFLVPERIVNQGCIFKIPTYLSFEEAALIEPLGCCIRAWNKLRLLQNGSLVIFGMGPIGSMHAMIAKTKGIKTIFCIDMNPFRLEFCKKANLGNPLKTNDPNIYEKILAQTENRGADLVIIATSQMSVLNKAVDIVRKGGTILLFGEPNKNSKLEIELSKIYSKEISIIPSYAATNENIMVALEMIKKKTVNVKQLITHKFSINVGCDALNFASTTENAMKIILLGKS